MSDFQGSNKCKLVLQTCSYVVSQSKHVKINPQNIKKLASLYQYKKFNEFDHHKMQQSDQTFLKYLFVLMSCNYCFWPLKGLEYEQLASNIRNYIDSGASLQDLSIITQEKLVKQMFSGINVPLAKQRARCVREVCNTVKHKFHGSFVQIVQMAKKSAVELLNILTANFANFQDHQIYEGHQIHFYKRAQLLIAGIWGKFQHKHLGQFLDIDQMTMFADYRVPQILNEYGILHYTSELAEKIQNQEQLPSGCRQQVQIRASTVIATQMIKTYLNENMNKNCISLQVDQFLWQLGESLLGGKIVHHHRTLTMYY